MGEINNKKNKWDFLIIITLTILVICLVGYITYDKVLSKSNVSTNMEEQNPKNNNYENEQNQKKYNVNDYISVSDFEFDGNCIDCTVKKIEFKTLPLRTITEFNSKHSEFIHPKANETAKLSNEIILPLFGSNFLSFAVVNIIYLNLHFSLHFP